MNKIKFHYFFAILFIFMATLMIGPRIPDEQQRTYCVHNIYLSNILGFSLNCDSPDFIMLANNPENLLEKNNVRQDRPGFVLFVTLIKYTISIFLQEVEGYTELRIGKNTRFVPIEYIYIYIYYVLINVLLVFASFFLFTKLLDALHRKIWFIFFIGLLFIYNDITKAFILSPHSQMLNIFTPMFCLWCFIAIVEHDLFARPAIFFISALVGMGVTVYASFFLFLPSVVIPSIVMQKRFQIKKRSIFFLRCSIIVILVILPSLLWYSYVVHKTGFFYSHSKEAYHQIIWMKETFGSGGFYALLTQFVKNVLNLSSLAIQQSWILLLILILFIIGSSKNTIKCQVFVKSPIIIGCIFISLMFIVFFAMVGLIAARVAYSAVPPLIVLTAYAAQHIEQRPDSLAYKLTPIIIFSYGIYELVKDGPYS